MLFTWLTDSRFLDWSLSSILVATVAIGGGLYAIQTRLIYMPYFPQDSRTNVYKPSQFGMPSFEEFFIKAADGCLLHLYFIPASFNSQANAGNIGHRLPIASHIRETAKGHINILMVSYRGYGLSGGSPTENGIRLDAQAALEYLLSRDGEGKVNPTKIVVYGQSIGGAVAIYLASTSPDKIAGLIVENTFISLPVLIRHVFPALAWAAPLLLHQLWESNLRLEELSAKIRDMHQIKVDATKEDEIKIKETKKNNEISIDKIDKDSDIGNVHQRRTKVAHEDKVSDDGSGAIKALFLSGSRDELIPVYHMQTLYTILKRALPTAKFVSFPDGTHNDTFLKTGYFDAINTFLSEL